MKNLKISDMADLPTTYFHVNAPRALIEEYTLIDAEVDETSLWPDYVVLVTVQNEQGVQKAFGLESTPDNNWQVKGKDKNLNNFYTADIEYGLTRVLTCVRSGTKPRAWRLQKHYINKYPEILL